MPSHPHAELSFHVGDACQNLVEEADVVTPQGRAAGDAEEQQAAALAAHQAQIKVPGSKPAYGVDEDGNPIEAPVEGIPFDAETGTLATPDTWDQPEPTTRRAAGREAAAARATEARPARAEHAEGARPAESARTASEPKG